MILILVLIPICPGYYDSDYISDSNSDALILILFSI